MLLSVIIPVYKTEHTLDRCVESVLRQDIDGMEIVLVDDGSPDDSPRLCDKWAERDGRIKVVHKENGGLGDARNAGVALAKGEYITFVDSDDYLSPDTYAPLVEYLYRHAETDILEYSVNDVGVNRRYLKYKDSTFLAAKDYWLETKAWSHAYAWNKIYKRSLFENVGFPVKVMYEDLWMLPLLLERNPVVTTTSKGFYNYCLNNESISAKPDRNNVIQLLKAEWHAAKVMRTHPFARNGWRLYQAMAYRLVDIIKMSI